jgi:hypothetical protein
MSLFLRKQNALASKRYRDKNKDKKFAHRELRKAMLRGDVVRPDTCGCGTANPQAHHPDYSQPLMVMWMCHRRHAELHRRTNARAKGLE